MSGHVPSDRPAPPRDVEGLLKAMINANPRDALQVLCGVTLRDGDVVTVEPFDFDKPQDPHDLLERVIYRIVTAEKHEDELLQTELGELVGDSLATQLVEALRTRGMNNILEQTETGREIARKSREEGREEGREQGHLDSMRAALRAAHGDITDLDELAHRLADRDHSENISRIIAGAPLDDLRA
jgi:hypothetical protein